VSSSAQLDGDGASSCEFLLIIRQIALTPNSNLPTGLLVGLVILLIVKIPTDADSQPFERSLPLASKLSRLDFFGLALLFTGCICLFLALQRGLVLGDWKSDTTIAFFVVSGIIALAFLVHEWALGDNAMLPASVLGQRSISMSCVFLGFSQASSYVVSCFP
jgi:hypothetical protein